jgi:hypothetical protein
MDSRPASAEEQPALYRAILARVGRLERAGARREAVRLRRDAIAVYARGWDDASLHRLLEIRDRADRELARLTRTKLALDHP